MRQLLLIASLVGLVMYAGFVSQSGSVPAAAAAGGSGSTLGALQRSFDATGGALQKVQLTGWVQVSSAEALPKVNTQLGWTAGTSLPAEFREAKAHKRDGQHFVAVRWVLTGTAINSWQTNYTRLEKALTAVGQGTSITVQLEGITTKSQPLALATEALNAIGAVQRQPWSDAFAASIAGRSPHLPAGPFGVNVQVAIRKETAGAGSRVWVAWPALQQEY